MAPAKKTPYDAVTERIVAALEAGVVPWHRPWRSGGGQRSLSSGKPYRGINIFTLEATAAICGYSSPWWTTFNQAKERGGKVRKGEKGTPVVFWKFIEKPDPDDPGRIRRIPFLRYFTVFNTDQVDDLDPPEVEGLAAFEPIEVCEAIKRGYAKRHGGPALQHGGDVAFYHPIDDFVRLPVLGQFESPEAYYAVLFHEFGHSTGFPTRLDRKGITETTTFGTPTYSQEELVAEMTAAFVCGEAGIPVNYPQSSAYIASWLAKLGSDPKLVVHAGGQAQRAADLILGRAAPTDDGSAAPDPQLAVVA